MIHAGYVDTYKNIQMYLSIPLFGIDLPTLFYAHMQITMPCNAYSVSPSFALFVCFCHSFQSSTIAALPSILRIFLFFLLWSCYLGLCLPTSAPDTLPLSLMLATPSLARPLRLHSLAVFRKLMWRLCLGVVW